MTGAKATVPDAAQPQDGESPEMDVTKLQQALAETNSGVAVADYEFRIRELTLDRDNLIEKLDRATKQKAVATKAGLNAQISALSDEVSVLRSRLAVDEAQPVPFTA